MPRTSRKKSCTNTYHVVIKGADRQLLFEERKDYIKYLNLLEYFKEECNYDLIAYCLMSNHVHLLIHHSEQCPLETIFRKMNTTYAIWYNMKYDRTGFVQNGRFYSEPIETKESLLNVLKYIHFNPTKAGLEEFPGASYPWSSFHDYKNKNDKFTDINLAFRIAGNDEVFFKMHEKDSDENTKFLDINTMRKRIPDDVAKDIIANISNCNTSTEFQNLSLIERNKNIMEIHKKGVSIRQLNRLTGIPRGVIERIVNKNKSKGHS